MKSIREWLILVKITQVYQPIIIKVAPSIGSIECIQLFSSWCKSEVKQEKREENHVAWIKKAFSCSPQNWHLRQFLWRRSPTSSLSFHTCIHTHAYTHTNIQTWRFFLTQTHILLLNSFPHLARNHVATKYLLFTKTRLTYLTFIDPFGSW